MLAQLQQTQGCSRVPDGLPVVVAPPDIRCVEPLWSRVAGVCLLGGPALDPESYGERRRALPGWTESQLDVFELVAIRRGMQVVNVARGGTPQLHPSDVVGDGITHRHQQPANRPTHWVTLSIHGFGPTKPST